MRHHAILIIVMICIMSLHSSAQDSSIVSVKYIDDVSEKSSRLQKKINKQTVKAVRQLQKQEAKIQQKLFSTDSSKATAMLADSKQKYAALQQSLQNKTSLQQYIPSLDTLSSSLKFLQTSKNLLPPGSAEKLNKALASVNGLEDKFQQAEKLQQFIKERKQYLQQQLGELGFAKQLKQLNKQAYYYSAQLNEYKALLKDHKKAERKALELLSQTKLFKDFMRKNSMLASLFRIPGTDDDPATAAASLAGLQTRTQVNAMIQQQLGTNPNSQQMFQQNMQDAQSQLNTLKNKVLNTPSGDGGSSDDIMPEGFTPNNQKVKSFLQRLELGTNIQSQKASGYFPTTSDIGVSLGYRINDKSIIGIGASYKMGWGRNIQHINITHQGVGLRSFIDIKLKGSFWISGGYEQNYKPLPTDLTPPSGGWAAFQQSGLIGLSKVISLKTKFLKKTKLQLLWDFMSYRQVPVTQPVVFRVGYNF